MRAAVLTVNPSRSLELRDVQEPRIAQADEVEIEVDACGVCGTDLHILAGRSYLPTLPFVLGHEPVGVVVGAGVRARQWLGSRVTMTLFEGCSDCSWCDAGNERLCPRLRSIIGVIERPGAFAERFLAHSSQLVPVPDELTSEAAATLVDSGATAANAVRQVVAHDKRRVAIIGGGPVGLMVAELLNTEDLRFVVVEPGVGRRAELAARGHEVVATLDGVTGDVDAVVECSGASDVVTWACERVDPRGLVVLAGYATVPDFDFAPIARKELTISGVRSGARADLLHVLDLAAAKRITPPVTSTWSLLDVNEAFSVLGQGALDGKAVVIPRLA